MQSHNVYNLVFSSSATVYGKTQYLPLDENHPTGTGITNPYGQTKFFIEQIIKDLAATDKVFFIILFSEECKREIVGQNYKLYLVVQ